MAKRARHRMCSTLSVHWLARDFGAEASFHGSRRGRFPRINRITKFHIARFDAISHQGTTPLVQTTPPGCLWSHHHTSPVLFLVPEFGSFPWFRRFAPFGRLEVKMTVNQWSHHHGCNRGERRDHEPERQANTAAAKIAAGS